ETSLMGQNKKQIQKHKPTTKTKLTEHNTKQKSKENKRSLGKTRDDDFSSHVRKQNGPSNQQGDSMVELSSSFPDMKQKRLL
ncbi:hypothetical protein ERO13_D12G164901v2, partial [Gossypium hirsutum]